MVDLLKDLEIHHNHVDISFVSCEQVLQPLFLSTVLSLSLSSDASLASIPPDSFATGVVLSLSPECFLNWRGWGKKVWFAGGSV